jgi:hypothetical protein
VGIVCTEAKYEQQMRSEVGKDSSTVVSGENGSGARDSWFPRLTTCKEKSWQSQGAKVSSSAALCGCEVESVSAKYGLQGSIHRQERRCWLMRRLVTWAALLRLFVVGIV